MRPEAPIRRFRFADGTRFVGFCRVWQCAAAEAQRRCNAVRMSMRNSFHDAYQQLYCDTVTIVPTMTDARHISQNCASSIVVVGEEHE